MIIREDDGRVRNEKFIATPPGCTIREQLEDKAMSVEDFAHAMGLTLHEANDLLIGVMEVTPSIAGRLEKVVGVSASFWQNLDGLYRDKLRWIEESEAEA